LAHPVFFGSAMTGAGIAGLAQGIREILPAAKAGDGELSGLVFKIERAPPGEKIAYVRLFSGTIGVRDPVTFHRPGSPGEHTGKITALEVTRDEHADRAVAGDIVKVRGLRDIRIGDRLGTPADSDEPHFAVPTLETVVSSVRGPELYRALEVLAEQDPLIDVRRDDELDQTTVRLYGEVQKEVLAAQLAEEFGVTAEISETRTSYLERPIGTGEAAQVIDRHGPNDFLATVGLRVEPAVPGSGAGYRLAVERGSLPLSFHTAIAETVHASLRQGRYGWEVTDCLVTLTRSGFAPPETTAADFRGLTPLVLMAALERAGTRVHEPVAWFEVEAPRGTLGAVLSKLAELGAMPRETDDRGVRGEIPAARVREFERELPRLTGGEGVFLSRPGGFRPVHGDPPRRVGPARGSRKPSPADPSARR
jgi:ribosomal protection tetracycline resistance protein